MKLGFFFYRLLVTICRSRSLKETARIWVVLIKPLQPDKTMPSESNTQKQQQQLYILENGCFVQVTQLALGTSQSWVSLQTTNNCAKRKLVKSWVRSLQRVPLTLRRWCPDRRYCRRDLQCHLQWQKCLTAIFCCIIVQGTFPKQKPRCSHGGHR